jgi:hypothetical protein
LNSEAGEAGDVLSDKSTRVLSQEDVSDYLDKL